MKAETIARIIEGSCRLSEQPRDWNHCQRRFIESRNGKRRRSFTIGYTSSQYEDVAFVQIHRGWNYLEKVS